jgi:flagellar hook-basal body complex protein FliE
MLSNAIAEADNLYGVTQQDTKALLAGEVDDVAQVMVNSTNLSWR